MGGDWAEPTTVIYQLITLEEKLASHGKLCKLVNALHELELAVPWQAVYPGSSNSRDRSKMKLTSPVFSIIQMESSIPR